MFCRNIELQKELDEYMDSSSLLEKELEASLDQKEKLIRELRQQNQKLDRENEFIKVILHFNLHSAVTV